MYKSDILIPGNASDRVSENLDFESFPRKHAPGPPRSAKNFGSPKFFAIFQAFPVSRTMLRHWWYIKGVAFKGVLMPCRKQNGLKADFLSAETTHSELANTR